VNFSEACQRKARGRKGGVGLGAHRQHFRSESLACKGPKAGEVLNSHLEPEPAVTPGLGFWTYATLQLADGVNDSTG